MTIQTNKIVAFQALRTLAFLGIFFLHSGFSIEWAFLGVSVFFVMSGFLMFYTNCEKEFNLSIRNNFLFSVKKIKKLYPLHIITMLCAVVLSMAVIIYKGIKLRSLIELAGEIFLNITLTQTWVPNCLINSSLNGVAWYLSVTLFLYFMFPYLLNIVKHNGKIKLSIVCVLLLVIEIALCVPFIRILGNDSYTYIWFMYFFSNI